MLWKNLSYLQKKVTKTLKSLFLRSKRKWYLPLYIYIFSFFDLVVKHCFSMYEFSVSKKSCKNWQGLPPKDIYLLRINDRNNRKGCKICSKLTIKRPEWHQWTYFTPFSSLAIVDFEQMNVCWVELS